LRGHLYLSHALARYVEDLSHLVERTARALADFEAQAQQPPITAIAGGADQQPPRML
jgi:hypothetical protein